MKVKNSAVFYEQQSISPLERNDSNGAVLLEEVISFILLKIIICHSCVFHCNSSLVFIEKT